MRLRPQDSAVTAEAVRRGRTIFSNQVHSAMFPAAASSRPVRSWQRLWWYSMKSSAQPPSCMTRTRTFSTRISPPRPRFWPASWAALLEATRLRDVSREEHRRAEILADVAQALHGTPDVSAVIEALADRFACFCAHVWSVSYCVAKGHSSCGRSRRKLRSWQIPSALAMTARPSVSPRIWRNAP